MAHDNEKIKALTAALEKAYVDERRDEIIPWLTLQSQIKRIMLSVPQRTERKQ